MIKKWGAIICDFCNSLITDPPVTMGCLDFHDVDCLIKYTERQDATGKK